MTTLWRNRKESDHYYLKLTTGQSIIVTITNEDETLVLEAFREFNLNDMSSDVGKMELNVISSTELEIDDFRVRNVNKGYGSAILETLLNYVKSFKYDKIKIVGYLSAIDEEDINNYKRRDHIYKKYGFEINNRKIEKVVITKQGRLNDNLN